MEPAKKGLYTKLHGESRTKQHVVFLCDMRSAYQVKKEATILKIPQWVT